VQRGARLEQLCFVCLFGGAKNSVLISFTFSSLFQEVVKNLNTHQIIFHIIDTDKKHLGLGVKKSRFFSVDLLFESNYSVTRGIYKYFFCL
jgi:hypothetical protein